MEQIDILMATYNGEKYLKKQIDSILNQTYSNIRLIISDDSSTDTTREIIKDYEKKDNRITAYYQENNLGYIKNFEFLLNKVESNIYMLSDQDDIWLPNKVKNTYNFLQKQNADMVFTDLIVVDEQEQIIDKSFNDLMNLTKKINKTINSKELVYLYNCVTGCTIMGNSKLINKILPIPTNSKHVLHDHWIALVNSMNGNIAYLPEGTIKYRQHNNNQIGIKHTTNKNTSIEKIREHFIEVKLGVFETYIKNPEIFPENIKEENNKAYEYFKMLSKKKKANFKGWKVFNKLYKNESFKYYIENFLILNIPGFVKIILKKKGE